MAALKCPLCKRQPKLYVKYVGWSTKLMAHLAEFKVECRKWFGLRKCFGPQKVTRIDVGYHDAGADMAERAWNVAVANTGGSIR